MKKAKISDVIEWLTQIELQKLNRRYNYEKILEERARKT